MVHAPNRRWFRWSLRTMFALVTVCCVLAYEWNWILARKALIERHTAIGAATKLQGGPGLGVNQKQPRAPIPLWLVGVQGVGTMHILIVVDRYDGSSPLEHWETREARRRFPEADIAAMYVTLR